MGKIYDKKEFRQDIVNKNIYFLFFMLKLQDIVNHEDFPRQQAVKL
jgi:hypothetical protein